MTPTGAPSWTLTSSHEIYGGHTSKTNYQSEGAVNPQTDVTAEQLCRMAADLAAVVRTLPFAVLTYKCNDAAPAAPTVQYYASQAGGSPTGTRNGDGDVTFAWSAAYADPYGVSGSIALRHAVATLISSGGNYSAPVQLVSGSSVRVRIFNTAGAAVQDATVTLVVWCGA